MVCVTWEQQHFLCKLNCLPGDTHHLQETIFQCSLYLRACCAYQFVFTCSHQAELETGQRTRPDQAAAITIGALVDRPFFFQVIHFNTYSAVLLSRAPAAPRQEGSSTRTSGARVDPTSEDASLDPDSSQCIHYNTAETTIDLSKVM